MIALAVVVLVLFGAYRSLGGAPPRAGDAGILLASAAAQLRSSLTALSTQLDAGFAPDQPPGTPAPRDSRRAGTGVAQLLDRLPGDDELEGHLPAIRALLAAAAEDVAWAWRMAGADTASPGLTAALVVLRDHAVSCCDQADGLLAAAASLDPEGGA